jgi:hypothetical protein
MRRPAGVSARLIAGGRGNVGGRDWAEQPALLLIDAQACGRQRLAQRAGEIGVAPGFDPAVRETPFAKGGKGGCVLHRPCAMQAIEKVCAENVGHAT